MNTANKLLRTLLDAISASVSPPAADGGRWSWKREPAGELKLAIGPHVLGAAGQAFAALGHACIRAQDDLERYMVYAPGGECPADEPLARCCCSAAAAPVPRAHAAKGVRAPGATAGEPLGTPRDTSLAWDAHGKCQNHSCLLRAGAAVDGGILGQSVVIKGTYDDLKRNKKFELYAWVRIARPFNLLEFLRSIMMQFYRTTFDEAGMAHEKTSIGVQLLEKMGMMEQDDLFGAFGKHVNEKSYLIVINDFVTMGLRNISQTTRKDAGSLYPHSTEKLQAYVRGKKVWCRSSNNDLLIKVFLLPTIR
ncbi:hypothetical protein U9M48_012121 [Paspalum notatum var. saurae]|uniref:Uncharacterized protein n=1 Tax=Paspalum notatum var. saurae TaxID=547442 RepID=A0AAQ3SWZ5_PASNO